MRSLLARLAVLGAFAVSMTACANGTGNSLPFGGPPNNAGGTSGTVQAGSNGNALIRFVQGSPPDPTFVPPFNTSPFNGTVDVCIDNLPFGITSPAVSYGKATPTLFGIAGGITHTIAVYEGLGTPTPTNAGAGAECPTAPGPYFGQAAIAVTTLNVGNNVRWTVVLGGTIETKTFGLYVYNEPTFSTAPAGAAVISHNAAPAFTSLQAPGIGVGFGICTTSATPCATAVGLAGAQNVQPKNTATTKTQPVPSPTGASVINPVVQSPLNSVPAGFYDGAGVPAGNPIPITSVAAPNSVAGQPYVVQLYAIDAPAGGLNLVPVVEQTLGFGF